MMNVVSGPGVTMTTIETLRNARNKLPIAMLSRLGTCEKTCYADGKHRGRATQTPEFRCCSAKSVLCRDAKPLFSPSFSKPLFTPRTCEMIAA
jgi:hypothetical protein